MQLDVAKLQKELKKQSTTLSDTLKNASVSRTAYYSLTRKDSVLPNSIHAIANTLGVKPSALLTETPPAEQKIRKLYTKLDTIMKHHPDANRDNVFHTLLLLEEQPIERLRRSLTRGKGLNLHRKGT